VEADERTVLSSWRGGKAKDAILDFVKGATTHGGPDFVAAADRIATFDNDGTLGWNSRYRRSSTTTGAWTVSMSGAPAARQDQTLPGEHHILRVSGVRRSPARAAWSQVDDQGGGEETQHQ